MNVNLVLKLLGLRDTNSEARYQLIMAGMFGPVSPVTSCTSCQNHVINPTSVVLQHTVKSVSQWSLRGFHGVSSKGGNYNLFSL